MNVINRIIIWILSKLIAKERKYQIDIGYTSEHDDMQAHAFPQRLLRQAEIYYNLGEPIKALAILEAYKEQGERAIARLSEIK